MGTIGYSGGGGGATRRDLSETLAIPLWITAIATSISAAIAVGGLIVALDAAAEAKRIQSCIDRGINLKWCD